MDIEVRPFTSSLYLQVITDSTGKKFWELDPLIWDDVNNVGLRNHYICCVYASRLMVPRKKGLIVTVSSVGGLRYLFNVAYGVGKAAVSHISYFVMKGHELILDFF